jgi:hypothetical protein
MQLFVSSRRQEQMQWFKSVDGTSLGTGVHELAVELHTKIHQFRFAAGCAFTPNHVSP